MYKQVIYYLRRILRKYGQQNHKGAHIIRTIVLQKNIESVKKKTNEISQLADCCELKKVIFFFLIQTLSDNLFQIIDCANKLISWSNT